MSQSKPIPIYSRDEIPQFENEAEYARFWDTHEITEELADETRRERERLGLPLQGRRATPEHRQASGDTADADGHPHQSR